MPVRISLTYIDRARKLFKCDFKGIKERHQPSLSVKAVDAYWHFSPMLLLNLLFGREMHFFIELSFPVKPPGLWRS